MQDISQWGVGRDTMFRYDAQTSNTDVLVRVLNVVGEFINDFIMFESKLWSSFLAKLIIFG